MNRSLRVILVTASLSLGGVPCASAEVAGKQTSNTGHFEVQAPIDKVFPLFDPLNEPKWSPDFRMTPIYPLPFVVAKDAIFATARHGGHDATWVINLYEPVSYRIEYLLFKPDFQVRRISIACVSLAPNRTAVSVTYRVTGVSEQGNRHLSDYGPEFIAEWGPAIAAYFAGQTHHATRAN